MTEMMPEENISPRQELLESQIETVVEQYGQFDQGVGEGGAHYVPESPFMAEGLMCSSCVFFEGGNACEIVAGEIKPEAICKFWIIPANLINASKREEKTAMKVTMNLDITAADVKARTLTGRILPFGEIGTPNIGRTKFLPNSLNFGKPSDVKLNLEHDRTKPVGRATDIWQEGDNLMASFKISNTTAGNDVLVEAVDGLRDGFSVEVSAAEFTVEDGVTVISKGDLVGVAVVSNPAFASAGITEIAASEEITEPSSDGADASITGETMDEVRPDAEAPVVEASAPAAPQVGLAFTSPRSPIVSAGSYLEHSVKAAMGDAESAMYVRAADSTSTNTGLTLPNHMNEMITTSISNRAAIDAISSAALPASGMSFTIPKFTAYPSVDVTAEGAAPSETSATSNYLTVNVQKFAGQQTISWELLDRSSPAFFDELIRELTTAYANATDKAVIAAFTASGTQATATAATALGLQSFIATEAAAAYAGTGNFAKNLVASAGQWAAIMGYYDTTNRPLYTASQPVNAPGNASATSIVGQVLGTNLYVDSNITVSGVVDESAFLVAPEAATWYESPKTELRVNLIGTGQLQVGVYGYGAIAIKKGAGIRRYNLV